MNIEKYQCIKQDEKYQQPEKLHEDFCAFLRLLEKSPLSSPAAVRAYNLLCGVEALLSRYETISRETLLVVSIAENPEKCVELVGNLHREAMHGKVFNPKMIVL